MPTDSGDTFPGGECGLGAALCHGRLAHGHQAAEWPTRFYIPKVRPHRSSVERVGRFVDRMSIFIMISANQLKRVRGLFYLAVIAQMDPQLSLFTLPQPIFLPPKSNTR